MKRASWLMSFGIAANAVIAVAYAGAARIGAQDSRNLRAEKLFDFQMGRTQDFKAQVGAVKIDSVQLTDLGKIGGAAQGGFASRLRGAVGDSEASTTVRAHILCDNPTSEKWELAFTLEYLDKNGKLIDRVSKKQTWDHEAKPYDIDHQLLEYVVPLIGQVRIKVEGRKG